MSLFRICGIKIPVALLAISLSGCVTYYHPRYADDGVYYGDAYASRTAVVVDPVYYPYWSLDYFYFSRYRHPYSVVVSHDPFFRPYPGWYYGYRPGPRFAFAAGVGYWYPWYRAGFYYHYYRPWYRRDHYRYHYHHYAKPAVERRQRAVAGAGQDQRGRDLYRAQRQDIRESFVTRTDGRRTLRDDGIPRPYDRTPARRAASDAVQRRATRGVYRPRTPATASERRARTGVQPRREQRGIPVPQRRAPAQRRREAAPRDIPVPRNVPSRPPVRSRAPIEPRRESAPPPSRPSTRPASPRSSEPSRSRSGDSGRRRR